MDYFSLYIGQVYGMCVLLLLFSLFKFFLKNKVSLVVLSGLELLLILTIALLVSWSIANRPSDAVDDTGAYVDFYSYIGAGGDSTFETFEPGFIEVAKILNYLGLPYQSLFMLIPFLLLLSHYVLCLSIWGRKSVLTGIAFVIFIFYPFFLALSANIIRQGLALCFVNIAIMLAIRDKERKSVIASFIAIFFHKSTVIFFPLLIFQKRIKKIPVITIVFLWSMISMASYLNFFSTIIAFAFGLLSSRGLAIDYSAISTADYQVGFRFDFWLFSSLSVGLLVILRLLGRQKSREAILFYMVCFLSFIHIAMFDIAFNDRFGIYIWIFYPLELLCLVKFFLLNLKNGLKSSKSVNTYNTN